MSVRAQVIDLTTLGRPVGHLAAFHTVNQVIPEDQQVLSVPPDTPAREALALMKDQGFSQVPVTQGEAVLGIFSYRAFALEAARSKETGVDLTALPVDEFLGHEVPAYARVNDDFRALLAVLDRKDSIVVSGPDELIAILTPMDVLNYLHSIANAFVLLNEIELALRGLIETATAAPGALQDCVRNALRQGHRDARPPERLEEMSFGDYVDLLRNGNNWRNYFERMFGGTRKRVEAKLEPVRELRNDVFHFRRELADEDFERLTTCRNWLHRRARMAGGDS